MTAVLSPCPQMPLSLLLTVSDDEGCSDGHPIPMPASVVDEFIAHCEQVAWLLECISCEKKIDTMVQGGKSHVTQHLAQKHTLMATTELTPVCIYNYRERSE